ncbi:hypothetical protein FB567DRAFT_538512 [Paraphoma chrysanthemicola]|uniref:Fungal N-terminal domain-containing protein n=1 Tax=Paraphoma chrysanthemicola TaxID=798071 RepID=A0A8K0VSR9_9PLEO|nr:hypothetical protein FB567DRAFT_538512 [Paraphoma chrysanthemicola]
MVPAFGFSVGDFIAAADLIHKVAKALKDKSGAANEYQHVLIELESLARTLKHLEALQPTESNAAHVNAIRGMALTCRWPLQDFLEKIQKFESTMGVFATGVNPGKAFGRKSQWAVFMTDEVARLRTATGAKFLSINLLLAIHTSESLSRVEAQQQKSHATLLASVLDLRSQATCANATLQSTQITVDNIAKSQQQNHEAIKQSMVSVSITLRNVSQAATATASAVMSFRDLGIQLLQLIRDLPQQVREALEKVVRTNLEMYAILREIQTSLARSPRYDLADTLQFEDFYGKNRYLPYEFFCHSPVFEAFLRAEYLELALHGSRVYTWTPEVRGHETHQSFFQEARLPKRRFWLVKRLGSPDTKDHDSTLPTEIEIYFAVFSENCAPVMLVGSPDQGNIVSRSRVLFCESGLLVLDQDE